jgi:hypothetical protein
VCYGFSKSARNKMLLKQYGASWPPNITIGTADIPPPAGLDDAVLSVERCGNPKNQLGLRLRSKFGTEYTAVLPVPASLQEKILLSIVRKKDITLREVGELPIP